MRPGVLGLLLAAVPLAGQADAERAMQQIRADYQAIQTASAAWDSVTKAWVSAGGEGRVARWTAPDGRFSKVAVRFDGDGASWFREYYFRHDSLFFAFDRWERYPDAAPVDATENRYYFAGGALVRWLARMAADGPNVPQDPEDAEYLNASSRVRSLAGCWVRFLRVAEPDWDVWGNDTGCAYM